MCGRFSFAVEDALIWERFGVRVRTAIYKARYHCAPTKQLAVVSSSNPGELSFYRWGLIPFWAKDQSIGNRLINAKSETVTEKASFRNAFRNRRCLVPSDGFFEWRRGTVKTPYRIHMKNNEPFAMAGIWDKWTAADGEIIYSFSILTTVPNALMQQIHERMPVILRREDEGKWLENTAEKELQDLLKPYPAEEMEAYPISTLVNSPKNDRPEIFIPASANIL